MQVIFIPGAQRSLIIIKDESLGQGSLTDNGRLMDRGSFQRGSIRPVVSAPVGFCSSHIRAQLQRSELSMIEVNIAAASCLVQAATYSVLICIHGLQAVTLICNGQVCWGPKPKGRTSPYKIADDGATYVYTAHSEINICSEASSRAFQTKLQSCCYHWFKEGLSKLCI